MKKLILALIFGLMFAGTAMAQSGCRNNSAPPLTGGGSVFGSIVSQWIQYFAQKIDVNNGVACNITLNGTISGTAFPINPGSLGTAATKNVGKSVNDPGTGSLENLLPVQTSTGAGPIANISNGTYLQSKVRRSNSGSAMTDTLPASTASGMANGTQIDIANVDASASDTISAGSGTTINGNSSYVLAFGRDLHFVYDSANTAWRLDSDTGSALLSQNNLNDVASASTSRTNLGLGTAATASTGTSGATIGFLNGNNTYSGTDNFTGTFEIGGDALTMGAAFTLNGGGTLSVASGKTLTASNTITFTGTDSTSFALPTTNKTLAANDFSNVTLSGSCTNTGTVLTCGGATTQSWTPAISTTATAGTPAYTTQVGSYEHNGTQVTARFTIQLSGWTGSPTGSVTISLPVTSSSASNDYGGCTIYQYSVSGLQALNYGMNALIAPNTAIANLTSNGNAGSNALTAAQAGTTPSFYGTCFYHT